MEMNTTDMRKNPFLFISLGTSGFSVFVLAGHLMVAYPALRLAMLLLILFALGAILIGAVPIGLDFALSRESFTVRNMAGASGGIAGWAIAVILLAVGIGMAVGG